MAVRHKVGKMKEKSLREFEKDLVASARFGTIEVRETGEQALDKWRMDCDSLVALAEMFLKLAEEACARKEKDLTTAWLFLMDKAEDCARTNLSTETYHLCCMQMLKRENRYYRCLMEVSDYD